MKIEDIRLGEHYYFLVPGKENGEVSIERVRKILGDKVIVGWFLVPAGDILCVG